MDRRSKALRYKRAQAQKKKEKTKVAKELVEMEDAWATVVYVTGEGYEVADLHEAKSDAEEVARLGTQKAMDDASHMPDRPYTVVFAVPVLCEKGYSRGTPYFANLRAAGGGVAHARAVSLWATAQEAGVEVIASAVEADEDKFTRIGGPVQLVEKKMSAVVAAAPAVPTKAERRATRLIEKRAARKAANKGYRTETRTVEQEAPASASAALDEESDDSDCKEIIIGS